MRVLVQGALLLAVALLAAEGRPLPKKGFRKFEKTGDDVNLAHVAKIGKESAGMVGELWKLGAGALTGTSDDSGKAHTNLLRQEDAAAFRHYKMAQAAKKAVQDESDAVSYGIDQRIAGLPESASCECARSQGASLLKEARDQVLSEKGAPVNSTDDCPCKPSVVGAVTEVLQEKLEQLTNELGSKAAASLAMKRALMSMRLPSFLASKLVKELDSEISDAEASESAGASDSSNGPLKVVVNNNMNGLAANSSLPYFYGYQNVPAYLKLGTPGQDSEETTTSGKGFKTVVVNVNNNIIVPPRHWHWDDWHYGHACHPYCFHHPDSIISALHSKDASHVQGKRTKEAIKVNPGTLREKGQLMHARQHQSPADKQAKVAKIKQKVQKLKTIMGKSSVAHAAASRGSRKETRALDADRADKLARQIHTVATRLTKSEASDHLRTAPRGRKVRARNPRWEAARQRLIDTAVALERVARNKAEAIREDMDVKARQASLQAHHGH